MFSTPKEKCIGLLFIGPKPKICKIKEARRYFKK